MNSLINLLTSGGRLSAVVGGVGILLYSSLYTVDGGEAAVIFNRYSGVRQKVVGEGTHIAIPILEQPHIFETRTRPYEMTSTTGSKDLQRVDVTLRVLFKPEQNKLPRIFSVYGENYDAKILPSIGSEILKAVVAQYDASELITQRELVSTAVRTSLMERAKEFNILLDDVAITHLGFSYEYARAIELKQVAQQEAEKARYEVEKRKQEKKAAIIRAEGEAESAKLIAQAMTGGKGFLELRRIEAAREIAENLARSKNVVYLPSNTNVFINTGGRNF